MTCGVVAALPPQPEAPNITQRIRTQAADRAPDFSSEVVRKARKRAAVSRRNTRAISGHNGMRKTGHGRVPRDTGRNADPLVETLTVNGTEAVPLTDKLAGTWHSAPVGAPLQVKEIVPV